jgi:hypothetical protein
MILNARQSTGFGIPTDLYVRTERQPMKYILTLLLFFPLLAYGESNLKNELDQAIAKMIELIDTGDGDAFMNTYAYIPDGQKKPHSLPMKKIAALREALSKTKEIIPTFFEMDTIAKFENEKFPRPLRFIKVDGKWKIMNN